MLRNLRMLESAMGVTIVAAAVVILSSCSEKPPQTEFAPGLGAPIASDPRIDYEFREKCGRDAQAWYHHHYEEDKTAANGVYPISGAFTSHYNGKKNKCLAVVNSLTSIRDAKTKLTKLGTSNQLTDVLENRDIGKFYKFSDMPKPVVCYVVENRCDSQEGFDVLVAPFMNE
jgi:hypothetical protein